MSIAIKSLFACTCGDTRVGKYPLTHLLTRVWLSRGGTQGGLNCLTHALPRCLPTPTEEADGNGYGVIAGRGGPSIEAAAQSKR